MNHEDALTLKDGRTLAYTIHGAADGIPVFLFHGNPGSRYMRHPDETIAGRLGVKLITPDRPGYGLSDFQKKRRYLDMADDIAQLADALKITQFGLMGISAGAPYVAATAYALRERVKVGAIISGVAPLDRPGGLDNVAEDYRIAYQTSRWPRPLLRLLMALQMRSEARNPSRAWHNVLLRANEYDQAILQQPQFAEQVRGWRGEAVRDGVRGWVHEAKMIVGKWGIPLNAINAPVHLWYWQYDTLTPLQMGQYYEKVLPDTTPHFMEGGGHFAFFEHWEAILTALAEDFRDAV